MIVSELITYLEKQPQDLEVAFKMHSEQLLLDMNDICIKELCESRSDGWIQNKRPDKPTRNYLLISGN